MEPELQSRLLGWVLLVVAVLLMTGGGIVWLVPGLLTALDSSDVHDWWGTSAGSLAMGTVSTVLALTLLVTGLALVLGRAGALLAVLRRRPSRRAAGPRGPVDSDPTTDLRRSARSIG